MINIITVKWGRKYKPAYVNKMFSMISRHTTLPFQFYCFTENEEDLHPDINVIPLDTSISIQGWWWKTYIFKQGWFPKDSLCFYIDLDMVILSNIDDLIMYKTDKFMGTRNVMYLHKPEINSLGSCILRWPTDKYWEIWNEVRRRPDVTKRYAGDQEFIQTVVPDIIYCPDEWIASYKWSKEHKAKIIAFHGEPRPHFVQDQIVLDNWK